MIPPYIEIIKQKDTFGDIGNDKLDIVNNGKMDYNRYYFDNRSLDNLNDSRCFSKNGKYIIESDVSYDFKMCKI